MKKIVRYLPIFLLLSCLTDIDINLAGSREYLVVEARLEHYSEDEAKKIDFAANDFGMAILFRNEIQIISLTKSFDVFGTPNPSVIISEDQAKVYVINENTQQRHDFSKKIGGINAGNLEETAQTFWFSRFKVAQDTEYTLHIITEINNQEIHYKSTTKANSNPGITQLIQVNIEESLFYSEGLYVSPVMQNITDDTFIMWDAIHLPKNDAPIYVSPQANGEGSRRQRFLDGEQTADNICGGIVYEYHAKNGQSLDGEDEDELVNPTQPGDTMLIKASSLTKESFVFSQNIYLAAIPNPDIPQGPVVGNIGGYDKNGTRIENEFALGYFNVSAISVGLKTMSEKEANDPLMANVKGTDFSENAQVCAKIRGN